MNDKEFAERFVSTTNDLIQIADEDDIDLDIDIMNIHVVPEGMYLTKDILISVQLRSGEKYLLTVQKGASK